MNLFELGIGFIVGFVISILALIKFSCNHKWKIYESVNRIQPITGFKSIVYIMQCDHCGKIKRKEIR